MEVIGKPKPQKHRELEDQRQKLMEAAAMIDGAKIVAEHGGEIAPSVCGAILDAAMEKLSEASEYLELAARAEEERASAA